MSDASAPVTSGRAVSEMQGLFRFGWGLVAALFGGLLLWSIIAPFEGAVLASGAIEVESEQQAIQHLEGGIVGAIYVKEGDRVGVGETLIVLDGTAVEARLASVEARLFQFLGQEARLIAERDGSDGIELRSGLSDLSGHPALKAVMDAQAELLVARAASRSTQVDLLNQSIRQLNRRILGLNNEIAENKKQAGLIGQEVSALEELLEKGLAPKPRLLAVQRQQSQLAGARESLSAEVATNRIQIGEARLELNQLTDGFREQVLTELREVQTQVSELIEQRIAAKDQLQRLEIISPRAGRVIGVQTHTVGGVIAPRDAIMHVVPENDGLIARIRIAPADIDKVQAGNQAILRFPAFSANATPEVFGTVSKVSADAFQDPQTGQFFFEGEVLIPEDRLANQEFALVPGMPVDASLRTESRTVISYLLKPLGDAMSKTFRE